MKVIGRIYRSVAVRIDQSETDMLKLMNGEIEDNKKLIDCVVGKGIDV